MHAYDDANPMKLVLQQQVKLNIAKEPVSKLEHN